jgi:F-type H+-transporting ATPase subunit gamma
MCGAFNANLIKAAIQHGREKYPGWMEQGRVQLICIGKKGADFFRKRTFKVTGGYVGVFGRLAFPGAQAIARDIVQGYLRGEFDRVEVIYNEFKNIAQSRIVVDQFLPVPPAGEAGGPASFVDHIYEPSKERILEAIVPKHLNFQVWRILLESRAAEEGARMTAMESATKNADDIVRQLQLQYNKARQASITKELLEVVGGAEALSQA